MIFLNPLCMILLFVVVVCLCLLNGSVDEVFEENASSWLSGRKGGCGNGRLSYSSKHSPTRATTGAWCVLARLPVGAAATVMLQLRARAVRVCVSATSLTPSCSLP